MIYGRRDIASYHGTLNDCVAQESLDLGNTETSFQQLESF